MAAVNSRQDGADPLAHWCGKVPLEVRHMLVNHVGLNHGEGVPVGGGLARVDVVP